MQRQIQLLRQRAAVALQHALGGEGRFKPQRQRNMLVDAQRVQQSSRHTHAAQQVFVFILNGSHFIDAAIDQIRVINIVKIGVGDG